MFFNQKKNRVFSYIKLTLFLFIVLVPVRTYALSNSKVYGPYKVKNVTADDTGPPDYSSYSFCPVKGPNKADQLADDLATTYLENWPKGDQMVKNIKCLNKRGKYMLIYSNDIYNLLGRHMQSMVSTYGGASNNEVSDTENTAFDPGDKLAQYRIKWQRWKAMGKMANEMINQVSGGGSASASASAMSMASASGTPDERAAKCRMREKNTRLVQTLQSDPFFKPIYEDPRGIADGLLGSGQAGVAHSAQAVYGENNKGRDVDNDGWKSRNDNCPSIPNPDQTDSNNNGVGDVCEADQANSSEYRIAQSSGNNNFDPVFNDNKRNNKNKKRNASPGDKQKTAERLRNVDRTSAPDKITLTGRSPKNETLRIPDSTTGPCTTKEEFIKNAEKMRKHMSSTQNMAANLASADENDGEDDDGGFGMDSVMGDSLSETISGASSTISDSAGQIKNQIGNYAQNVQNKVGNYVDLQQIQGYKRQVIFYEALMRSMQRISFDQLDKMQYENVRDFKRNTMKLSFLFGFGADLCPAGAQLINKGIRKSYIRSTGMMGDAMVEAEFQSSPYWNTMNGTSTGSASTSASGGASGDTNDTAPSNRYEALCGDNSLSDTFLASVGMEGATFGDVLSDTEDTGSASSASVQRQQLSHDPLSVNIAGAHLPPMPVDANVPHFTGQCNWEPEHIDIKRCRWQLGDGATKNGGFITHRYDKPGRYTVNLTVTAEDGEKASAQHSLTVKPPTKLNKINTSDSDVK